MSYESYLATLNFCDVLEQALEARFPNYGIRVLPKNERLSNATYDELPAVFTIEVQLPGLNGIEGIYCKWCADVCAEDYIQNWGEGEKRKEKLARAFP